MKLASLVILPFLLGTAAVHAQRPPSASENIDASKLSESGPAVVGGTGATVGPNSKNQAVDPMPGLREQELSERPRDITLPSPSAVRPLPGSPPTKAPVTPTR
jgi:hypothetical protein